MVASQNTPFKRNFNQRLNDSLMLPLTHRIQQSLDAKKMSWSKASQAIGLSPQAPNKWKKGQISKETLEKLADLLEVDLGWLLSGKETEDYQKPSQKEPCHEKSNGTLTNIEIEVYEEGDPIPEGYVAIDYYPEIRAGAGLGYINIECHSPYKMYLPTIEVSEFGANPETSKIFRVDGESMIPDLFPNQRVSIDTSAKKIYDGEIYAFLKGEELKIKILFDWSEQGVGGFKAVSRNTDKVRFPDEYYSPARIEAENVQILGQYWWKAEGRKVRR